MDPQTPSAFQASPPLWGEGLARCFCTFGRGWWDFVKGLIKTPSAFQASPPLWGEGASAVFTVVTTPSHRGEGWGGVCCLLHATCRAEGGGNCRKYGDYDVEDFAPNAVVVECSHSEIIG